ncbi:stem 28 kDa glycoprotein-like [Oryza brachyantha]|uniref:Acid phosphatase n=1 Tax=Oryza brachyantha TaxID=4533 RepID=J3M4N5_ORYBR|nr:stem 28 kDa glycoprotein-like [Oryza brachyantha]
MATARLFLLLLLLSASCSAWEISIRMPTADRLEAEVVAPLIHALRPLLGSGGQLAARAGVACDSWRLGVEAHNVINWKTVPAKCEGYVGHYLLGGHYRRDSAVVVDEAIAYAETLQLAGNGKEVWIFDIDETSLSNLPYYAKHGFGVTPYNDTSFREYVAEGSAPALPETRRLYRRLLEIGVKPVFLTGRTEDQRAVTVANLRKQGYSGWEKLLLKPAVHGAAGGLHAPAVAYKSGQRQKLKDSGFIIVGNIGDQWSDILGEPEGARTFKLPDPLYYIG